MLDKLDKFDLSVLDDLSYVRKDHVETSALFELIAHRYERPSLAITANQPFSAWTNVFPDPAMAVAAIDRLVHHSTIIEMNAESYRNRSAVARSNPGDYHPPNGAPARPSSLSQASRSGSPFLRQRDIVASGNYIPTLPCASRTDEHKSE